MSTTPKSCAHVCTPNRQQGCPSRTSVMATNTALLEALGLASLARITSVDITLRPDELPRITVQQICQELQGTTARFRLLADLAPPPPIRPRSGLDAQCAEAQRRLHKFIERSAFLAHLEMLDRSVKYEESLQ